MCQPNADSYGNGDGYGYSNSDGNCNTNFDCASSDADSDGYCNSHANADAYDPAEAYTNAQAASDARASSVALIGTVKAGTRETNSRVHRLRWQRRAKGGSACPQDDDRWIAVGARYQAAKPLYCGNALRTTRSTCKY